MGHICSWIFYDRATGLERVYAIPCLKFETWSTHMGRTAAGCDSSPALGVKTEVHFDSDSGFNGNPIAHGGPEAILTNRFQRFFIESVAQAPGYAQIDGDALLIDQ